MDSEEALRASDDEEGSSRHKAAGGGRRDVRGRTTSDRVNVTAKYTSGPLSGDQCGPENTKVGHPWSRLSKCR